MTKLNVFCLIFCQSLLVIGCPRTSSKQIRQARSTQPAVREQSSHVWHPATYRGLTMGRSTVAEMRRIFGRPKHSEVFNRKKSNAEVWYHYNTVREFAGTLRVVVDQTNNIVKAIDIQPRDLSKEEAIKHFGSDYIITKYDFDSCLGDEESAPLFESLNGSVTFIEYRKRGIAIAVDGTAKVNEISYVSKPIGAKSSRCK